MPFPLGHMPVHMLEYRVLENKRAGDTSKSKRKKKTMGDQEDGKGKCGILKSAFTIIFRDDIQNEKRMNTHHAQ